MAEQRKKDSFLRRLFRSAFLLLNIGAIGWLLLCSLASTTSPEKVYYLPIFSLTTAISISINVGFVFYWLLFTKKKIRFLLSLVTLIVCYKVVSTVFGFNYFEENDMASGNGRVKLMTWNIHGMGMFNGRQNQNIDAKIIDVIKRENPDILCLPEFPAPQHDSVNLKPYAKNILDATGFNHFYYQFDNTLGTTIYFGTAIFTKYPLIKFKVHRLAEYTYLLQGDVRMPDSSIMSMYFVHLHTFGLSDNDKAYIEKVRKRNTDIKSDIGKSKTFIWKFNRAFAKRAREVDSAMLVISQSEHPTLICGDFNDLPGSYTYTTFRGELKDALIEKGKGLGRTYNQIFPTIRIDHVFYDDNALELIGFKTPYSPLSDHNPVIANFKMSEKPSAKP